MIKVKEKLRSITVDSKTLLALSKVVSGEDSSQKEGRFTQPIKMGKKPKFGLKHMIIAAATFLSFACSQAPEEKPHYAYSQAPEEKPLYVNEPMSVEEVISDNKRYDKDFITLFLTINDIKDIKITFTSKEDFIVSFHFLNPTQEESFKFTYQGDNKYFVEEISAKRLINMLKIKVTQNPYKGPGEVIIEKPVYNGTNFSCVLKKIKAHLYVIENNMSNYITINYDNLLAKFSSGIRR